MNRCPWGPAGLVNLALLETTQIDERPTEGLEGIVDGAELSIAGPCEAGAPSVSWTVDQGTVTSPSCRIAHLDERR